MSVAEAISEHRGQAFAQREDARRAHPGQAMISVVIPTLNEAANLPHVLTRLPDFVDEVVLVDGHSVDDTIAVARSVRPDVRVVRQDARGKGNALACGFAAASGDIIVMLDGDGSTDPAEIPQFVAALLAGNDFAKGSRFAPGGASTDITSVRRLGNGALKMLVNVLFRTRYTDLCYGYNAFWRHCLPHMHVTCDGFEVETLLNVRVARAGLRVAEVASVEHERLFGESKLHAVRDGLRVLRTIVTERMRRNAPNGNQGAGAGVAARDHEGRRWCRASGGPDEGAGAQVAVDLAHARAAHRRAQGRGSRADRGSWPAVVEVDPRSASSGGHGAAACSRPGCAGEAPLRLRSFAPHGGWALTPIVAAGCAPDNRPSDLLHAPPGPRRARAGLVAHQADQRSARDRSHGCGWRCRPRGAAGTRPSRVARESPRRLGHGSGGVHRRSLDRRAPDRAATKADQSASGPPHKRRARRAPRLMRVLKHKKVRMRPSDDDIGFGVSGSPLRGTPGYAEVLGRLVAENDALARRVQRLAPVLASMARDLAEARRENAILKRENRRLRAHVTALDERSTSPLGALALVAEETPAIRGLAIRS
jgi:hypothetical protein